jgi:hypothetical protein
MTGVGMLEVGLGNGVGLLTGTGVGKTKVGSGVGSAELRKTPGPTKLRIKLTTTMMLKTVVIILALRLLRVLPRLRLERPNLSSFAFLPIGSIIPRPSLADNVLVASGRNHHGASELQGAVFDVLSVFQADRDPTQACQLAEIAPRRPTKP